MIAAIAAALAESNNVGDPDTWPEAAVWIGVSISIAIGYAAYRFTGGGKD